MGIDRIEVQAFDADGALAFTAPDGEALPPEPPREIVEDAVAFLRERAADQGRATVPLPAASCQLVIPPPGAAARP